MKDIPEIKRLIAETERELAFLDSKRSLLLEKLKDLKAERDSITAASFNTLNVFQKAPITNQSAEAEKNLSFPQDLQRKRGCISQEIRESQNGQHWLSTCLPK